MDEFPKDRLRKAMEAATGMASATEVWNLHKRVLRVGKDLFISNLNGNRDISKRAASAYASAFGVTAGWLLYGDDSEDEAAPVERSRLAAMSALAATLSDADARELYRELSARIEPTTPRKSAAGSRQKTEATKKSGQRTHS